MQITAQQQHGIETDTKARQLICEKLGLEPGQLVPGSAFSDDLGIDSLDLFELLIAVEDVFDIHIPEQEGEKLTTPDALIEYIKNHTY